MPVVFLHPVGLDGNCWQFLEDDRLDDAIRYTCLWHGGRPKPEEYSIEAMADDVAAHTEGPIDAVGLSMGGSVALQLGIRHPDRVRSLMLCCASAGGSTGTMLEDRARSVEETGIEGVMDSTMTRWFSDEALATPNHPGVAYVRQRLLTDDKDSFANTWRALGRHNAKPALSSLKMPTTVLHAAEDKAGPIEDKKAMADAIPGARFVVIPGPHMVHIELPEVFAVALFEHLAFVDEQTKAR